jgi:hypothetical protein
MSISLRITEEDFDELKAHLFPGDDEHGAVLGVGVVSTLRGKRLLVRKVFKARDGVDYVPGDRGYRKLTAAFVAECLIECEEQGLGYVAVHCHGGVNQVSFSMTDLESHERGYPALLESLDGMPVGALVFAKNAVAGDIWLTDSERYELNGFSVIGNKPFVLTDGHDLNDGRPSDLIFDRQVRMFGEIGQRLLQKQKVAVIGAGGVGAIVVEQLGRMGVGEIVIIDDDRVEQSNLNRLVGSIPSDVSPPGIYKYISLLSKLWPFKARLKVDVAKRHATRSGSISKISAVPLSVTNPLATKHLLDSDYIFLAADTAQARLVYNSVVNQYLIPGVQMGVKIQMDKSSGGVVDIAAWVRRTIPGNGCLWCNGLISPAKLREESLSADQKRQQQYIVGEEDVHAPSIIMLNGIVASLAVDAYVERLTGLSQVDGLNWLWYMPLTEEWEIVSPVAGGQCTECRKDGKRFAKGDALDLPVSNGVLNETA